MIIPDHLVSCLSELLVASHKYRILFGKHVTEDTLVSFRKGKVADLSKYIDRIGNKMPLTYILEFEGFTGYLVVDTALSFVFGYNTIKIEYNTYSLELTML